MELLKKITCQNCGGELLFEAKTQLSKCNFCGSEFTIRNIVDVQLEATEKIIPFKTNDNDFEIAALTFLSQGELTPDDILESSLFADQVGVFIPMWVFEGRYDGSWSASSGYNRMEEYYGKGLDGKMKMMTRTVTDWRPANGACKGDFLFLACGNNDNFISEEVKNFANHTLIEKSDIINFEPHFAEGFSLLEMNLDKDLCWKIIGKKNADYYVETKTKQRIPGDKYKDLYLDVVYDNNKTASCFVPFWIVNYEYQGIKYNVYMDGFGKLIQGVRPIDNSRMKLIKDNATKCYIFMGISVFIGVVLAYTFKKEPAYEWSKPEPNGFFIFGSIVLAFIIFYFFKNKKEIFLRESKNLREEKLKQKLDSIKNSSSNNNNYANEINSINETFPNLEKLNSSLNLSPEVEKKIIDLLIKGHKLEAIKILKESTSLKLKECIEEIEHYQNKIIY